MCVKALKIFFLCLLFCSASWLLVSQETSPTIPGSEITMPSAQSSSPNLVTTSEENEAIWQRLIDNLGLQKQKAEEQATASQATVQASNATSQASSAQSTQTQSSLQASAQASTQTSSSVAGALAINDSLQRDFDTYKTSAEAAIRANRLKSALWRVGGLSGVLGVAGGLVSPVLGHQAISGAEIGLAGGAVIGIVWGVVEYFRDSKLSSLVLGTGGP